MIQTQIGKLLISGERDAIHIAVAPVVAAMPMNPGDHIGFTGTKNEVSVNHGSHLSLAVGIVDPFLEYVVEKGQKFYMFLYPNTITSLTHKWTHPAFDTGMLEEEDSKATAEHWIAEFAAEMDQTYRRLMKAADLWVQYGEFTSDNQEMYKDVDPTKWPIFWKHFETLTGLRPKHDDDTFFTCSC